VVLFVSVIAIVVEVFVVKGLLDCVEILVLEIDVVLDEDEEALEADSVVVVIFAILV